MRCYGPTDLFYVTSIACINSNLGSIIGWDMVFEWLEPNTTIMPTCGSVSKEALNCLWKKLASLRTKSSISPSGLCIEAQVESEGGSECSNCHLATAETICSTK